MRIGDGRVSTRDQNPDAQHDALTAAGCEQVLIDTASGTLARRPEHDKALLVARRGGDQLVVTKLDRIGVTRPTIYRHLANLPPTTPLSADTRPLPTMAGYDALLTRPGAR